MPLIEYTPKRFRPDTLALIDHANSIIAQYAAQGYDLTLRQIFYQFVARTIIPNTQSEYNRIGAIIADARMAGLVDWDAIVDRTRHDRTNSHWEAPVDVVRAAGIQFATDKWTDQIVRCACWIEKDALVGILDTVCPPLDVPYFSCRGYPSASALWRAAQDILGHLEHRRQPTIILHLGDHDPSGLDMTRDIRDRLNVFCQQRGYKGPKVIRIALNMDQVQQYQLPPNPAKTTDSRYGAYIEQYGDDSWELDALDPPVLAQLIQDAVAAARDDNLWEAAVEREHSMKREIEAVATHWTECVGHAQALTPPPTREKRKKKKKR